MHATYDADVSLPVPVVMPVRVAAACAATAVVQHHIQQRYVFAVPIFAWGIISPPGGGVQPRWLLRPRDKAFFCKENRP